MPTVLIVEDEAPARKFLQGILEAHGYETLAAENLAAASQLLDQHAADIVLLDVRLPDGSGLSLMERALREQPGLPIIVATGHGDIEMAVEAMKAGAADFISKPIDETRLVNALRRAADQVALQRETVRLRRERWENHQWVPSSSPQMREVLSIIERVAKTDANVLILGESGTGKNMVADLIHRNSARMRGNQTPVVLNCPTIAEQLLESELFGHEKGAFTGAIREKLGRVEEADGGSIFLDEIGDMSRPLQAKLLRFLEDGSFSRVGGNEELRVNVRIIAATNREIVKAIKAHEFREDLYHRLNVVQFRPTPLRERGSDVLLLARHFLKTQSFAMNRHSMELTPAAEKKLLAHNWPGNVRELRNVMERAVILEPTNKIQAASLPDFHLEAILTQNQSTLDLGDMAFEEAVQEFEKRVILTSLRQHNMNLTKAADQLKISRHALRYRMQRLHLDGHADEDDPIT